MTRARLHSSNLVPLLLGGFAGAVWLLIFQSEAAYADDCLQYVRKVSNFAIIYALVAGPRKFYWGVLWAMMLEIGMLLSYPTFLQVRDDWAFRLVSLIGHIVYGTVLGLTVRRFAREPVAP